MPVESLPARTVIRALLHHAGFQGYKSEADTVVKSMIGEHQSLKGYSRREAEEICFQSLEEQHPSLATAIASGYAGVSRKMDNARPGWLMGRFTALVAGKEYATDKKRDDIIRGWVEREVKNTRQEQLPVEPLSPELYPRITANLVEVSFKDGTKLTMPAEEMEKIFAKAQNITETETNDEKISGFFNETHLGTDNEETEPHDFSGMTEISADDEEADVFSGMEYLDTGDEDDETNDFAEAGFLDGDNPFMKKTLG